MPTLRRLSLVVSLFVLPLLMADDSNERKTYTVSTYVDYATTAQMLVDLVVPGDLEKPRGHLRPNVDGFRDVCRERGRDKEVDRPIAAQAFDVGNSLLDFIAASEEAQKELERIYEETDSLIKTSDAERNKAERQARIDRKVGNLERRWKTDAEDLERVIQGRLRRLMDMQEKFDTAIDRGIIIIKGAGYAAAPPPPRPQPPPAAEEPPAQPYNEQDFKGVDRGVRVSDGELKTPDHMLPIVTDTAEWLNMQQRRIGGQLVSRMYGEVVEGRCYLYLQTTEIFNNLGFNEKNQLAKAIQGFWAMKCKSRGKVGSEERAHIVMMDTSDMIVVTSDNANATWLRVLR